MTVRSVRCDAGRRYVEAAYAAAGHRHAADRHTWWHTPLSLITGGFKPNCRPPCHRDRGHDADDGGELEPPCDVGEATPPGEESRGSAPCYVHNGHLILQGPNYALAKTLQNWRTVVARAGPEVWRLSANVNTQSKRRVASRIPILQPNYLEARRFSDSSRRGHLMTLDLETPGQIPPYSGRL